MQLPASAVVPRLPRLSVLPSGIGKNVKLRATLLAAFLVGSVPAIAHAQVIEIADDGSAQVFGSAVSGGASFHAVSRARSDQFNVEESLDRAALNHGIDPGLLRAVAWQESRGNISAVSVKGALGIMQLMPATAAALGVDPRDPEANINGGAAYLALQLAKFGSVELALAAYNAGPGAVIRYGGVPPYRETRDYVSIIMRRWNGSSVAHPPATADRQPSAAISAPQSQLHEIALPLFLVEVPNE